MSIKNKIKKILNENQIRSFYGVFELLPDKLMIELLYLVSTGRKLNLKNPKRFTEKLQWYKLNYKNSLMTICADKYRIREYIKEKGYADNLVELYQVCDSYDQIKFSKLPNSFVIKSNNGSGTNIFITDKRSCDFMKIEEVVKTWKKVNTISIGREWAYKNIVPKIIIEELLIPTDEFQKNYGINDYKILCFNGKPRYAWVDVKRHTDHRRNFYDLSWNQLNVETDKPNTDFKVYKPAEFEKMLDISREIAKDFPFVRVDFYNVNKKIYIGELTFYPWSGCVKFTPDEFDYELGEAFELPSIDNR